MAKPDFWQRSQDEISRITQERAVYKDIIDQWQRLRSRAEDAGILARMAREEKDESTLEDVEKDVNDLEKELEGDTFLIISILNTVTIPYSRWITTSLTMSMRFHT